MKKKWIGVLLFVAMLLSVMSISVMAEGVDVQLAAGTDRGAAVSGTEIQIPVSIVKNPGLVVGRVNVEWDHQVLNLTGITYGTGLGQNNDSPEIENDGSYLISFGDYTPGEDPGANWEDENVVLFTLNFVVLEDAAAGTYPITLTGKSDDFLNNDIEEKSVAFTNGSVELYNLINTVELAVEAPVKGATPQATVAAGTGYTGTVGWSGEPEEFAANTAYTATVVLTPEASYEFAAATTATVNGAEATAVVTDGKLVVTYTFPATEKAEVASAALEIAAPKTQKEPVTSVSGTDYTGVITWSPEVEGKFAEGVEYTATVELTPVEGTKFAESFTATVNGENVEFTVNEDGTATGTVAFPATGEPLNSHLQWVEDDSELYADTNLWTLLKPESQYYKGTNNGWTNHSTVRSVTIPVKPGDKIYASSFGAKPGNGGTSNGIAVTFFYGDAVISFHGTTDSDPNSTYNLFKENGYLIVPEGANAVCVPMWNKGQDAVLNILTLPKRIAAVNVTDVTPVPGATPVTEVAGEEFNGTVVWEGNPEKFATETVYSATFTLTAKEGYKFPADATATVNGETAVAERNEEGKLVVTYTFPATGKNQISSVALSITAPVKDQEPQNTIEAGENYTGTISWNGDPDKFAPNTVYTATVVLTPNESYAFAVDTAATVNGESATVSLGEDGKLSVTYEFPATAPKDEQTITCDNVTATYGDAEKILNAVTSGDGAITYAVAEGEDVISIADGKVTFKKAGNAKITITVAETERYAAAEKTVEVTVSAADYTYAINALAQYIKVGSELSKISVAPAVGSGVNGEAVSGSLVWYTDEVCTEEATAEAFAAVGDVTLYGAFTATDDNYVKTAKITAVTFKVVANGDVNADGRVSTADAMIFFRYIADWSGYAEKMLCMDAADINNNGNVNLEDATCLARYLAGWKDYVV